MARIPTLMPCKCGGKAELDQYYTTTFNNNRTIIENFVICHSCGRKGTRCKTRTQAAHAWNEEMLRK